MPNEDEDEVTRAGEKRSDRVDRAVREGEKRESFLHGEEGILAVVAVKDMVVQLEISFPFALSAAEERREGTMPRYHGMSGAFLTRRDRYRGREEAPLFPSKSPDKDALGKNMEIDLDH